MYTLIRERVATMTELKEKYNLDEALKLYDIVVMQCDIERMMTKRQNEERG